MVNDVVDLQSWGDHPTSANPEVSAVGPLQVSAKFHGLGHAYQKVERRL
ncbi:hypothetical protein [Candidatus Aalborgicola defluviihabitans]|nr:hypothetical protein [Burkholderiales bacterium]